LLVIKKGGEDVWEGGGVGKMESEMRRVRGNLGIVSMEYGGIEALSTGGNVGGNEGLVGAPGSSAMGCTTEGAGIDEGGAGGNVGADRDRNRFSILLKAGTTGC
jgi:hypothetical protein